MTIVSIDPGVTTGVAVRGSERGGTFLISYHMSDLEGILPLIWLAHTVLIETIPGNLIPPISSNAYPRMLELLLDVECIRISPGHWKPIAKKLEWKVPAAKDQHQKDAYNMLRYWIRSTLEKDILDE